VLENTAVIVQDGRITAVGRDLATPPGAREITGKVVCAGFIDPWSTFGIDPEAIEDERTSAGTLTLDAVDPYVDRRLRSELLRAGITSMRVQAGSVSRVGGVGALLRIQADQTANEEVLLRDCCVAMSVGLTREGRGVDLFDRVNEIQRMVGLIAEGETYLEEKVEYKHDLAEWEKKIAEKQKELEEGFKKAKKEREKEQADAKEKGKEFKEKAYKEDKKPKAPKFDPDKEVLARVANGEVQLIVEVHRASELRGVLDGTERFGRLRMILAGATDAMSVADRLKERHIPVLVWPAPMGVDVPDEFDGSDIALAGRLQRAGVEVLLGGGGRVGAATRDLPLLAALAVGQGFDRQAAFEALTLGAARALDVDSRIGSIERGKEADLLVLDGEPLASTTHVRYAIVGGDVVITPEDR
jgi:imidazolonepropionase-like amidohydrolase